MSRNTVKPSMNNIEIYKALTGRNNATLNTVSAAIEVAVSAKRSAGELLVSGKKTPVSAEDGKRIAKRLLDTAEQLETVVNRSIGEATEQMIALDEKARNACNLSLPESYIVAGGFYRGLSLSELNELNDPIAYKLIATCGALGATAQQQGVAMKKIAPEAVAEIEGLAADITEYEQARTLVTPLKIQSSNFEPNPRVLAALGN